MATFQRYRCKGCGYEVRTEPRGFYALFSGQYYNFKCSKCKDIVSLSANDLYEMEYAPKCPICGNSNYLSTWNPIEGKCPMCNGEMEQIEGVIMAD